MKSMRYIVTRPCLQEGSLSILKYLQSTFAQSGPAVFVDDKGEEHAVQVDTERARVWGLGGLYHAQHLGVNDVLTITNLAPARYQVEATVKPYAPPPSPRREPNKAPETRRVVVSSTPHVREIRMQEVPPQNPEGRPAPQPEASVPDGGQEVRVTEVRTEAAAPAQAEPTAERGRPGRPTNERSSGERSGGERTPGERASAEQTRAEQTTAALALPRSALLMALAISPSAPPRLSLPSSP